MLFVSLEMLAGMVAEYAGVEIEFYGELAFAVYVSAGEETYETIEEIVAFLQQFGYEVIEHSEYEISYTLEYGENRVYIMEEEEE